MREETDTSWKGKKPTPAQARSLQRRRERHFDRANKHYRLAVTHLGKALEHAKEAGDALLDAKRCTAYKDWTKFLDKYFVGSRRTAQVYMRIARKWEDERIRDARVGGWEPKSIKGFLDIVSGMPDPKKQRDRKITNKEAREVFDEYRLKRDRRRQKPKLIKDLEQPEWFQLPKKLRMQILRQFIREDFASQLQDLKYEELVLMEQAFTGTAWIGEEPVFGPTYSCVWEAMYAHLREIVWRVLEEDAKSIDSSYEREWEEMRKTKRIARKKTKGYVRKKKG
jgi:hypothetical protein